MFGSFRDDLMFYFFDHFYSAKYQIGRNLYIWYCLLYKKIFKLQRMTDANKNPDIQ